MEEDVKLIDIDDGADILDVAVGDGHVIVLTKKREVWAIGQGYEGQLGLGKARRNFHNSWTRVCGWKDRQVLSVGASGWNSFVTVEER